jgi:hypothetical protein
MILGRVDEVDGHFIGTKFIALALPTESLYVTPRNHRSTSVGAEGLRIPTDWRSVVLAYARVWLPLGASAVLVAEVAMWGRIAFGAWLVAAGLLGISALAYGSGRLPETEKARLRLLGTVTGLKIDPSKLAPSTRAVKRDALGDLMDKAGIPMTPEGILDVLEEIPMPAIPLVYGYAAYSGDDPPWTECAAFVYARYLQGDFH